jgi:hypothetical protein
MRHSVTAILMHRTKRIQMTTSIVMNWLSQYNLHLNTGVIRNVAEIVHNEHGLDGKRFVSLVIRIIKNFSLSFKLKKIKPFIF